MLKKSFSLVPAVILAVSMVCAALVTVSAEVDAPYLTVNADSNYFPAESGEFDDSTDTVTVTYFLKSSKNVLNANWKLSYDPEVLEPVGDSFMPQVSEYNAIYNIDESTGLIVCNCSSIRLFDFSSEAAFVQVDFKTVGSGETNVNLEVVSMSVADLNADATMLDFDSRIRIVWHSAVSDNADVQTSVRTELCENVPPSTEPSKPATPSEPATEPSEPSTTPSEPATEPSEPSTTPSEPATEPSEPSTTPSEPITEPSEPSTTPSEPITEPSEPVTTPSEPATEPSEPSTTPSKPATEPSEPSTTPSEPITEPSTEPSEEPEKLVGDVNNDNTVDINDVTFIQMYLAGYKNDGNIMIDESDSRQFEIADFHTDGIIDINDATAIQMYLAGYKSW